MSDSVKLGRLLHIRALNYLRREHPLTYVGSRILVESLHKDILDDWTIGYIQRRAKTGRSPVYWQHSLFKGLDAQGKPEYRNCLVGSPSTLLQEIWALWRISQDDAFATPAGVYSYLWSTANSHRIFRHFLEGYHEREGDIAAAARLLNDPYVVVLDLKRFYPSINIETAFKKFENRIGRSKLADSEKQIVLGSAAGMCRRRKKDGLAIGPPLSHVIASIYLENVDQIMNDKFSGKYFRYVDDVALVVEKDEVHAAKLAFQAAVEAEKLSLNEDKTDIHPAAYWYERINERKLKDNVNSFGDLVANLAQYLAHNPEDFDAVSEAFQSHGFSIPFTNVRSVAEYSAFRSLAKQVLELVGLGALRRRMSLGHLLDEALRIREVFTIRAKALAEKDLPGDGIQRRWAVQNIKFIFNRILYLYPRSQLSDFESLIPPIAELAQIRAIYRAIITGDATDLLAFTGHAVAAFAQLWSETQGESPKIDWPTPVTPNLRDSAIVLSLYDVGFPPPDWIQLFRDQTGYNRTSLQIAAGRSMSRRKLQDHSYIDEIESLFLTPNISIPDLLRSRFDNNEAIFLPALSLGENSAEDLEIDY